MIKTTLKIDGMMCGMCESHMNDVIRKNFKMIAALLSEVHRRGRRSVFSRGQLSRVAVRQQSVPRLHKGQPVFPDHFANPRILPLDLKRLLMKHFFDLRNGVFPIPNTDLFHPVQRP